MTISFEEKYQAIINKDSSYEGLFFTAVKTTGIFCRPVCTARKPKVENVEFFSTINEALNHGYRPCKLCRPLEQTGKLPGGLQELLDHLIKHPEDKVKDSDLIARGLMPNTVRRWFKKNYGMTFHDYQRKLRLNLAYKQLSAGKSVTHTAYDLGYESVSGFSENIQKVFEAAPSQLPDKEILNVIRITTPLGLMIAAATGKGILMLEFADRKGLEDYLKKISNRLSSTILPGYNDHLVSLEQQLISYFQGKQKTFNLSLQAIGTSFQQEVWGSLVTIPYGSTRTYSTQAELLGRKSAVRAVAAANGQNRIAIAIPCHRVIGKNGELTGYAGGVHRKKWLLDHEQGVMSLGF
jgi:AraC family transcriptional regulator of adaptative response/methylated-DNA-[protein]-cysteine methyltransferase